MNKTNAVRILEANQISHRTFIYTVDENDLSGTSVAHKINIDEELVYKTLVTRNDKNEIFVFCIPVNQELNLKKAAAASGSKNIEMIKLNELLPLTGYIRGGCSPIGMKKKYPVIVEETAQLCEMIVISAGIRGMQVEIAPNDLAGIVEASFADVI
jgi:Cys-tRNA(Pro)/Cys-tRNA(Cys) deacylase